MFHVNTFYLGQQPEEKYAILILPGLIYDIRHFQSQFREFLTDQKTNLIKYDLDICKKLISFHRKDFFVYTL